MGEPGIRVEGIVRASRRDPGAEGKPFLGVVIECADGNVWVISYEEQSPLHALADRHVLAIGEPYKPTGQYLLSWHGSRNLGHLRVSSIQRFDAV